MRRSIACDVPDRGYWSRRRCSPTSRPPTASRSRRSSGRSCRCSPSARRPRRSRRPTTREYGLAAGIWTDKGAKAFEVARALQAGVVWQNTYNHFDPTAAFGGYKESGFGREGGPAGLRPYLRCVVSRAPPSPQDLQAVRSAARSCARSRDATTARATDSTSACARARTCATPSPPRARRPAVGGAHRLQPRPDPVPRSPRRSSRAAVDSAEPGCEVEPAIDVLAALRRLDRQAARRARRRQPRRRAVPVVLAARADRRGRGRRARRAPLLGLVAEIAPALAAGNTVVAIVSDAQPLGGLDLAEVLGVSDVPGGVVNLLSGRRSELAPALGGHRDLNAIVDAPATPTSPRSSTSSPPRRSSACATAPRRRLDAATADALDPPRGRDRAQDGLAPHRRLAGSRGDCPVS